MCACVGANVVSVPAYGVVNGSSFPQGNGPPAMFAPPMGITTAPQGIGFLPTTVPAAPLPFSGVAMQHPAAWQPPRPYGNAPMGPSNPGVGDTGFPKGPRPLYATPWLPKALRSRPPHEIQALLCPAWASSVVGEMGTGDLLLMFGMNDSRAKVNRFFQGGSWFSHSAMVIRDPPPELLQAYGTPPAPENVYVLEVGSVFMGTTLRSFSYFLQRHYEKTSPHFMVCWRKLVLPGAPTPRSSARLFPALCDLILRLKQMKFEENQITLLLCRLRLCHGPRGRVFCSEALVWALMAMGVVRPDVDAAHFFPIHFSEVMRPCRLRRALLCGNYNAERLLVYDGPIDPEAKLKRKPRGANGNANGNGMPPRSQ